MNLDLIAITLMQQSADLSHHIDHLKQLETQGAFIDHDWLQLSTEQRNLLAEAASLLRAGDPVHDGTPDGHPAYWRGYDSGVAWAAELLASALSEDVLDHTGQAAFYKVRVKVLSLLMRISQLEDELKQARSSCENGSERLTRLVEKLRKERDSYRDCAEEFHHWFLKAQEYALPRYIDLMGKPLPDTATEA